MFVNGWMNNQNAVHIYNEMSFTLRKEYNSDICYNMNETCGYYGKWNKPVISRTNGVWFHIHKISRVVLETEIRLVAIRSWGRGNWEVVNGYRIWALQDEKVQEIDWTALWIYLILLHCVIKNG